MARAIVIGIVSLLVGCGRKAEPLREILPVPVGTVRVDSVPEGTLAEGSIEAFGLKLPRPMRLVASLPDAVHAKADLSLERVSNYVRERVEAERVETAPRKTVFLGAKLPGTPRVLRVEVIAAAANRVELVVRDETPRPMAPGLSEEERWRRAGQTPDGRVLPEQNR